MKWSVLASSSLHLPVTDSPADLLALFNEIDARPPRRTSRFIQLAVLGAHGCVAALPASSRVDVLLGTYYGNIDNTYRLLADVCLAAQSPSPFDFVNVSSNLAAFYVAGQYGLQGAAISLTTPPSNDVLGLDYLAMAGSTAGQCLLGRVEEGSWPLDRYMKTVGTDKDACPVERSDWLLLSEHLRDDRPTLEWYPPATLASASTDQAWTRLDGGLPLLDAVMAALGEQRDLACRFDWCDGEAGLLLKQPR